MAARERSPSSPKKSSPARSKAGSRPAARAQTLAPQALLTRFDRGDFPASVYLDGPDEGLKAALLAELRRAWAHEVPEAPMARVFSASEETVDELLAAFHGGSLFTPRELFIVLDVEDLTRSEKRILALAEGIARPAGASCMVLVESAGETVRKSLEALRGACSVRCGADPPIRMQLLAWGTRRMAQETITVEAGAMDAVLDACEGDAVAFFDELEKLVAWAGPGGRLGAADVANILRPVVGADLPGYLGAVAAGDAPLAARRLGL
ncbi:MAG TPA: hypothetical protein VJY35_16490, partial [Candidatus Eisenbacteria bacterium]|nr:hypothetical protein [Candidatus Eisenbacteria bacterium]